MKNWLKAFRLRTLPLSLSVILIGNALATPYTENFSWLIFTLSILTTVLLQILSNLANDYGDAVKGADNEGRIGPKRAVQSGAISMKSMKNAIILFALLSLVSGLALLYVSFGTDLSWTLLGFLILGLLSIAAAIKYTVGKGAYGYAGLGDVFVFLFFGIVGVMGPFYLQTQTLEINPMLIGVTMGCFSTAVLNLNNMRDVENDKAVGKNTLVVKIGAESAKLYHYSLFFIAYFAFALFIISRPPVYLTSLFIILPVITLQILHLLKVYKISSPKDFDPELKKVAITTFMFAIFFSFMLMVFGSK